MEDQKIQVKVSGIYGDVELSGSRKEIIHILGGAIQSWTKEETAAGAPQYNETMVESFFKPELAEEMTIPMVQWLLNYVLGWEGTVVTQK